MIQFCKDVDLVKWEPLLFSDCVLPSQILCKGEGAISGTTFSDASGKFVTCQVKPGHVIYLFDASGDYPAGAFEVIEVLDEDALTVSIIRGDAGAAAIPLTDQSPVSYRICSYDPQSQEASRQLLEYFNIEADESFGGVAVGDVRNQEAFRQAAVFSVLAALFISHASGAEKDLLFWEKSLRYQHLFQTARTTIRLIIDHNQDGHIEQIKLGGSVLLRRV